MKTPANNILRHSVAAITAAAFLASTAITNAGKPGGGGGGGGGGSPPPAGTIYYYSWNGTGSPPAYSMKADGTQKTALGVSAGFPGRMTHGGKRLFLRGQDVAGTNPDGTQRRELFVQRDDGTGSVQLTDDSTFHFYYFDWTPAETANEAIIAGIGWHWNADGSKNAASMGVYTATLVFDGSGNVTGLVAPPAFLISVGTFDDPDEIYEGDPFPDVEGRISFSPDMTRLVADHFDGTAYGLGIRIIDIATGTETQLVSGPSREPAWSPDGAKIAFMTLFGEYRVDVISVNGTGRITVYNTRRDSVFGPMWSPDSAFVAFTTGYYWGDNKEIYRVPATGGSAVKLTGDIAAPAGLLGWR